MLGLPIQAVPLGPADAQRRTLVAGCIHGDECATLPITRRLARGPAAADARLVVVPELNPDGRRRHTRVNARGVNLNRNFAGGWRRAPRGSEYPGPRPLSEPETRAARRLILRERPQLTIWFHQQYDAPLVRAWGRAVPAARRYARLVGLPFQRLPWPAGSATRWQNTTRGGGAAFVVEFRRGRLSAAQVRRHAAAVRRMAQ